VHKVVAATNVWIGGETPVRKNCQAHYWALRQQARHLFAPFVGEPGVVHMLGVGRVGPRDRAGAVVALLWWWGVVFDLWIVVASI
jgi:hypothetical protein